MRDYKRIALFLGISLLTGAGLAAASYAQESATSDKARLCKIYNIETVIPRVKDNICPGYENDAGLCVRSSQVHCVFSYIQKDDGGLDFGLSFWFASGAHCGLIGNAKPTDGGGWRYEDNMQAENPAERCAVTISEQGGMVWFDADETASCRAQCGAQAHLRGVAIPLSALDSRDVKPSDFNPEVFFNTPCGH